MFYLGVIRGVIGLLSNNIECWSSLGFYESKKNNIELQTLDHILNWVGHGEVGDMGMDNKLHNKSTRGIILDGSHPNFWAGE